jgi:glyoxalase family protein
VAITGVIRGTHHLTFCVGGAQEDYDFHARLLGLKSVKKTVLFDGEIPIYHLYYGNGAGDLSTLLTSFPYRQAGWMGTRGTNQAKRLNLAIPVGGLDFWAQRLTSHGLKVERLELFDTDRLRFQHPCGIEYMMVADPQPDDRVPYEGAGIPGEAAIRGAYGTTTSVHEVGEMDFFLVQGMGGELVASDGPDHQYRIGTDEGHGRMIELVEERDLSQGTWHFGEGTIHHHAFDAVDADNQQVIKDRIVGLGFTDVSEPKDRGYFYSMYLRSPGGLLCESPTRSRPGSSSTRRPTSSGPTCAFRLTGRTGAASSRSWSRSTRSRRWWPEVWTRACRRAARPAAVLTARSGAGAGR